MTIKYQKPKTARRKIQPAPGRPQWNLRLYIAGKTPQSVIALNNLRLICQDQLKSNYSIELIDILKHPRAAHDDQILAIPTLIRKLPLPQKNIIGDLSDRESLLAGLDLMGR